MRSVNMSMHPKKDSKSLNSEDDRRFLNRKRRFLVNDPLPAKLIKKTSSPMEEPAVRIDYDTYHVEDQSIRVEDTPFPPSSLAPPIARERHRVEALRLKRKNNACVPSAVPFISAVRSLSSNQQHPIKIQLKSNGISSVVTSATKPTVERTSITFKRENEKFNEEMVNEGKLNEEKLNEGRKKFIESNLPKASIQTYLLSGKRSSNMSNAYSPPEKKDTSSNKHPMISFDRESSRSRSSSRSSTDSREMLLSPRTKLTARRNFSTPRKDEKPEDSFFRSPFTTQQRNFRRDFKDPPTYKGPDGRYYVAFFTNKYIFSNHFVCPDGVTIDDMEFPTTEHYYMYRKALFHGDKQAAKKIYRTDDPKEAKRITTKFDNFDTSGWKRKQYKVMETACLAKFRQNSSLRHELFRTCNAVLVEASPSDVRWGVGLQMDDPDVADESRWRGSNLLGHLLMNVRTKLASEYSEEFESILKEAHKELRRRAIKL